MNYATTIVLAGLTACASSGATLRSGVGDRFVEQPPYVAGSAAPIGARILVLPVQYQRGASQAPLFDPVNAPDSPVAALVGELTATLDSLGQAAEWVPGVDIPAGIAPDVYFGCALDATADCVERGDSVLGRRGTTMHLALRRPSSAWIAGAREAMTRHGATHALLVTLEVGQYWVRQRGLLGKKSVELGTDHTVELPWLTSLETPVSVLQLTAALVDQNGHGTRISAEGIAVRRTHLPASSVGAQRVITSEDVAEIRTLRRDDLPGRPLAWHAALLRVTEAVTRR